MTGNQRDEEFSAFVVARRVGLLRSACLLTAGDPHLAEDLVQTALSRLYVAWPRVRRAESPDAYARRVVVNAYLDEVRRPRWRREEPVAEPPDTAGTVVQGPWQDAAGVDGDAIRYALAELPARMRAAVVLRHWMDLSVDETAELLGCSDGTVKSQTAKGIAKLRALLGGPAAGGPEGPSGPGTARSVGVVGTGLTAEGSY